MAKPNYYGLILAGGRGTRFWPRSRRAQAKQVLRFMGERSLIQDTVGRLGAASGCSNSRTASVMSKYLAYREIVFRDRQLLLDSLADLGFSNVEVGDDLPLYGYQGDRRSETAAAKSSTTCAPPTTTNR